MGQITAGVNYKETTFGAEATSTVSVTKGKTEQWEYGVAYAVTPNLSVGANYTKAENNSTDTTKNDAKSKSIAVGYNLGPIALSVQAAKLENYTFVKDVDADVLYLRASTKF
jgi:predicted porin